MQTALILSERLVIDDPIAPVEALFLGRANTNGDLIAWLPRQRVVASGDVVVSPVPYMFYVYPSEWLAVLERLRALRYDVLIPGHGAPIRDTQYLDSLSAFIEAARKAGARAAAAGKPPECSRLDVEAWRHRIAGTDSWYTEWFEVYAAEPLLESAHQEATGAPLGPPASDP